MMKHKTRDIVDALESQIEQALNNRTSPSGEEMNTAVRRQFPGLGDDQLRRAYAIVREEIEEGQRESRREVEEAEAFCAAARSIFEGLPHDITLGEAAKIKAAQGDPLAQSYQKYADGAEYQIQCALWEAAVDAHPHWKKHNNRSYRWTGQGEAPSTDHTIEWFQLNHPTKAREIEREIAQRREARGSGAAS